MTSDLLLDLFCLLHEMFNVLWMFLYLIFNLFLWTYLNIKCILWNIKLFIHETFVLYSIDLLNTEDTKNF